MPGILVLTAVVVIVAVFGAVNINLNNSINKLQGMVEEGSQLVALKQKEVSELSDRLQLAVDAQPYPVAVFVGFQMQVGCAACPGRSQQRLQPGHGAAGVGRG